MIALLAACSPSPSAPLIPPGDPCEAPGAVCTWLGVPGIASLSGDGVDRLSAQLYLPVDLAFAADGTAYFPDYNNHRIRRVDPDSQVTTVSGDGLLGDSGACWAGCEALASRWDHPLGVVPDPADPDQLYVAVGGQVDRIVQSTDTVYAFAGGDPGYAAPSSEDLDGDGFADGDTDRDGSVLDEAAFGQVASVAFGADGALYVSDPRNQLIRRITADGAVEDLAGSPGRAGFAGDGGPADEALVHTTGGLAVAGDVLYFADALNGEIRALDLDTLQVDRFAGAYTSAGTVPAVDPITGEAYEGDAGSIPGDVDGPADQAVFDLPRDVAVGLDGEVYVTEPASNCVRVIADGVVSPFAGTCGADSDFAGDGGPALDASFDRPYGVAVDSAGDVYIADTNNQVIRRVKR